MILSFYIIAFMITAATCININMRAVIPKNASMIIVENIQDSSVIVTFLFQHLFFIYYLSNIVGSNFSRRTPNLKGTDDLM
jgi:hypothetical protein